MSKHGRSPKSSALRHHIHQRHFYGWLGLRKFAMRYLVIAMPIELSAYASRLTIITPLVMTTIFAILLPSAKVPLLRFAPFIGASADWERYQWAESPQGSVRTSRSGRHAAADGAEGCHRQFIQPRNLGGCH